MFTPEEDLGIWDATKLFLVNHWRGLLCLITPLVLLAVLAPFPPKPYQWCAYTLLLMAVFWVFECIPIAVTSFFPIFIFPLTGVLTSVETCQQYTSDAVLMFLGSIILAYAIEQSGLHKRLAYGAIKVFGYSHLKLLGAIAIVTTFVSMWVTNTAATTMMVPINFAVLRVFEAHKIFKIYDTSPSGETYASDITTCYFCTATFSATIGGIGTLVGTGTNLSFKGLFNTAYPKAPEYLSFPKFSAFGVPFMIVLEIFLYLWMAVVYFGLFRPKSKAAKAAIIPKEAKLAAQRAILEDSAKMGGFTFWELIVLILFSAAMLGFFCRSPQMFTGWGDLIEKSFGLKNFIKDSALAFLIAFIMFLFPSSLKIFKNFTVKKKDDLPKTRVVSVLDWTKLNAEMPFSFSLLLGGGFALSKGAETSGLNAKLGETMQGLKDLPNLVIILIIIVAVIAITNFASNVAVANVMCPIAMQLAKSTNQNPLWYCIVSGFCASFCFLIPVGTPGNLIVQSVAKIPTGKMIIAGSGPTLSTILITFIFMGFFAPVIWPDLHSAPAWIKEG